MLRSLYNRLIIASKPDIAVVKQVIDTLAEIDKEEVRNQQSRYRNNYDAVFMSSLAQVAPASYRSLLSDPKAVEDELQAENERQAGPFYAFVGDPQMPPELSEFLPEMIRNAFRRDLKAAAKHIEKVKYQFTDETALAAFEGCAGVYWGRDTEEETKAFDWLVEYIKPNAAVVDKTVEYMLRLFNHGDFASSNFRILLTALEKHVPTLLSQKTREKLVRLTGSDEIIKAYLKNEKNPTLEFQKYLFEKSKINDNLMQWVYNVDPSFFQLVLDRLRPKPIDPMQDEHKSVPDKKKRATEHPPGTKYDVIQAYKRATKQITIKRQKTPEERAKAIERNRREAISNFIDYLDPLIRDPASNKIDPLNPKKSKIQSWSKSICYFGKEQSF